LDDGIVISYLVVPISNLLIEAPRAITASWHLWFRDSSPSDFSSSRFAIKLQIPVPLDPQNPLMRQESNRGSGDVQTQSRSGAISSSETNSAARLWPYKTIQMLS
jgi:hypothetical protein